MEPISMIVGALVAGASTALKETASQAVKDAYRGLKTLIIKHWKSETETDVEAKEIEANMFLKNLESNPACFQKLLERKLNEIMPKPETELINQAQQLEKLLKGAKLTPAKYIAKMKNDNKGIQIGDANTQNNTFK